MEPFSIKHVPRGASVAVPQHEKTGVHKCATRLFVLWRGYAKNGCKEPFGQLENEGELERSGIMSQGGMRALVRMTPAELQEFLNERRTMSVATLQRSGRPHLVAMWYGLAWDAPVLWTYAQSQKVANIRRDPRVTCLVEDGGRYEELRGVELVCTGEIRDDPQHVITAGRSVYERYLGPLDSQGIEKVAKMSVKRVAVRLDIQESVSWDHRKLRRAY